MSRTLRYDSASLSTRAAKGSEHEGTCPLCHAPGEACSHCMTCGNAVCGCGDDDAWSYRGASKTSTRALDLKRIERLIEKLSIGWTEMSDVGVFNIANSLVIITGQRVTSHPALPPCESGNKHDYLMHLQWVWGQLRAGRASWADLWCAADSVSVFFDPRDGYSAAWAYPLYEFDDVLDDVPEPCTSQ